MIPPDASESTPTHKTLSPYAAARPLRLFVGRHNRQALLLSGLALVAAALRWATLYGFAYWFTLVTYTVSKSFNVETIGQISDATSVTSRFPAWFAVGAVAYLAVAAFVGRHYRPEKIREARLYFIWVFLEFFMAVPNVTFSFWGNLRAITKLGKTEVVEAWQLLQRMNAAQGRLSLNSLRLEIEDEKTLCRVVFTLQLIGLVGIRENSQGWFLYLQGKEVHALLAQTA